MAMAKRGCSGKTKAGKRCKSTSVRDNGFCFAHQPEEVRKSHGFGGPQEGAGRPRKPRAVDVLRERIENDIDRWLQPLEDGITAQRGIVVGDGPTAHVEYVEDHPTQIKAHREAFDRAFGRPTQPTRDDTADNLDAEIAKLLGEMDGADPRGDDVVRANGNGKVPHE